MEGKERSGEWVLGIGVEIGWWGLDIGWWGLDIGYWILVLSGQNLGRHRVLLSREMNICSTFIIPQIWRACDMFLVDICGYARNFNVGGGSGVMQRQATFLGSALAQV